MKAKRIAEIAHKVSQLNKEMDAISAALKDEHGPAFAAQLIAKAIIENTFKAITSAANSDQLRAELTANNIEMNRLTERNDVILSTLRVNGLEPANIALPLSDEQLREGEWYCKDITEDCRNALLSRGIQSMSPSWPCKTNDYEYCVMCYDSAILLLEVELAHYAYDRLGEGVALREIIRKGNEFYYV